MNPACIHLVGNLVDADRTGSNDLPDGSDHLGGMIVGVLDHRLVTGGLSVGQIGWIPNRPDIHR